MGKALTKGAIPENGDRIVCEKVSANLTLAPGVEITLGSESVLQITAREPDRLGVFLVKGRVRVKTGTALRVATAAGTVTVRQGLSDILIANLNTLAISREGAPLEVETCEKLERVPSGHYALLTTEGAIAVTALTGD